MDLILVYAYHDESFASGLAESLASRGIEIAAPLSLWPGQRLLQRIDARLSSVRYALVIVSAEFLKCSWWGHRRGGSPFQRPVLSDRIHASIFDQ
jgi:hypothetical protein